MILLGNAAHFSWNSAYLLDSLRVMMREGTQLGVAKAARSPPCTHPFPGRRSILVTLSRFHNT